MSEEKTEEKARRLIQDILKSNKEEKKLRYVQSHKRSVINIVVAIAGYLVLLMALNSDIVVYRLNAHIGLALLYVFLVWNFVLLGIAIWREKNNE